MERMQAGPAPDAGDALDAAVAERVMGWKLFKSLGETFACTTRFCRHDEDSRCMASGAMQAPDDRLMFEGRHFGFFKPGWSGSRNPADALEVFERAVELFGSGNIIADMEDARGEGFVVSVSIGFDEEAVTASGPLPLAICLAALKAVVEGEG